MLIAKGGQILNILLSRKPKIDYMDSGKDHGSKLMHRLQTLSVNLGDPVIDPEVEDRLNAYWSGSPYNTFYLLVDVRGPRLLSTHRVLAVLGYSSLDMQQYLQLIHPSYRQLYLEFGASAYLLAYKLSSHLEALGQVYTIQFPLKTAENGYWWVNQMSEPLYFDKKGQMVVHLNTYQLFRPYQKEAPTRPMLVFPNLNLQHEFREVMENLLQPWLSNFTAAEKKLLFTYWEMYEHNRIYTNEQVADLLGWTLHQVTNRNKQIKQKAERAFPISDFRKASDVALTLYRLFGKRDSSGDNQQD